MHTVWLFASCRCSCIQGARRELVRAPAPAGVPPAYPRLLTSLMRASIRGSILFLPMSSGAPMGQLSNPRYSGSALVATGGSVDGSGASLPASERWNAGSRLGGLRWKGAPQVGRCAGPGESLHAARGYRRCHGTLNRLEETRRASWGMANVAVAYEARSDGCDLAAAPPVVLEVRGASWAREFNF